MENNEIRSSQRDSVNNIKPLGREVSNIHKYRVMYSINSKANTVGNEIAASNLLSPESKRAGT